MQAALERNILTLERQTSSSVETIGDKEVCIVVKQSIFTLTITSQHRIDGEIQCELVYDLDKSPAEVAEAIVAILSVETVTISEDVDPFVDDIWDDLDLTDEEVAALASDDGVNWAEYPDHEYQEGCDGKDCKEAYYGKDSLIAGDIPGRANGFVELISMRFHNMGFDEIEHPLLPGRADQMWNPFGKDSVVMYGDSKEFFDPLVTYIESEVGREDSAWYKRDYEVCEVEGKDSSNGAWALCIEAREYDQGEPDFIPKAVKVEYARRRKLRKTA